MTDDWETLDRRHAWHPYTQHGLDPEPLAVARAEGAWLELADGRRLLDAISSWWAILHGHREPALVDALTEQAGRLDHVLYAGCTHEPAARLAAELAGVAPPGLERVFYSDDGSTAVEVALKLAWLATRRGSAGEARTRFVALEGGYHGDTFGAMSAGDPRPFFEGWAGLLFGVDRVPADEGALLEHFRAHGEETVAVVLEPRVQGAAGMRPVPDDFVRAARRVTAASGALLVADEVMTGFGRTGALFATGGAGVAPDLLCLSKGLTGGMLPLAATLATPRIYEAFRSQRRDDAFFHGHTFTANPLAAAVARASLALVLARDVPARLEAIGRRIEIRLGGWAARAGHALRRVGGIVAVEVEGRGAGYATPVGERLRRACREDAPNVLLRPLGNVVYAMPPACTTEGECDLVASAIERVVDVATR